MTILMVMVMMMLMMMMMMTVNGDLVNLNDGDNIQYGEDKDENDGGNNAEHFDGDDADWPDNFDGSDDTNNFDGNVANNCYGNDAEHFNDCMIGGGDLYDLMKKCQQVRNFKVQNHSQIYCRDC